MELVNFSSENCWYVQETLKGNSAVLDLLASIDRTATVQLSDIKNGNAKVQYTLSPSALSNRRWHDWSHGFVKENTAGVVPVKISALKVVCDDVSTEYTLEVKK